MQNVQKMLVTLLGLIFLLSNDATAGDVRVKGYYRKDGTYVPPHYRSSPDDNFSNNWSTYGNRNPYTGKLGWIKSPRTSTHSYGHPGSISDTSDIRISSPYTLEFLRNSL
jgi:hypothetical protein